MNMTLIFLGGGMGSLLRYFIGLLFQEPGTRFPWGTLLVNLLGCFILGGLMSSQWGKFALSDGVRLGLGTGLLGGFTTFSTFGRDAVLFLQAGEIERAALYILTSVVGGVFCAYLGIKCVESMGV